MGKSTLIFEQEMIGNFEIAAHAFGPGAPVLDVVAETLLPGVKIDGGDAETRFHQGYRDVYGDGRFTRSALFIADDNNTSAILIFLNHRRALHLR